MTFSFPKSSRLLKRAFFRRLSASRKRFRGKWVIIDYSHAGSGRPKLGITISKKFGKAHERNRFKRIVREAFRLLAPSLPDGLEMNVLPRSNHFKATRIDISHDLKSFLDVEVYAATQ